MLKQNDAPREEAYERLLQADTAEAMRQALEHPYLGFVQTVYARLSDEGKLSVAQGLVRYVKTADPNREKLESAFQRDAHDRLHAEAKGAAIRTVLEATTAAEMRTALESPYHCLIMPGYEALADPEKDRFANRVLRSLGGERAVREDVQRIVFESIR